MPRCPSAPSQPEIVAEGGGNRTGHHFMGRDFFKGGEQAGDIALGLIGAPAVAGIAINFVETVGRRLLDADGGHALYALLRAMTSAAVSGWYEESGALKA